MPMRILVILFVIVFLHQSKAFTQNLEDYQWKNRIILLKDAKLTSTLVQKQWKLLNASRTELDERDIVLFVLTDTTVYDMNGNETNLDPNALIKQYKLSNFKGLILLGKDGGIKLKKEFLVNASEILNLIDSMPMRIIEMRRAKKID